MANFLGCGFARVAVKLSILKANGKVEYDHEQRWKKYSEIFQGVQKSRFEVDKIYIQSGPRLLNTILRGGRLPSRKLI